MKEIKAQNKIASKIKTKMGSYAKKAKRRIK